MSVVPKAKGVKLPPSRKEEPAGLLEECFSEDGEAYLVNFEYFHPTAHEVSVAGSFNGWQTGAAPLKQQRGGKWSTSLLLAPGRYEYRFVVDDANVRILTYLDAIRFPTAIVARVLPNCVEVPLRDKDEACAR